MQNIYMRYRKRRSFETAYRGKDNQEKHEYRDSLS